MKSSRRPRPKARQADYQKKGPPYPGAWSIVLIDAEPIRKKARRDYSKVLKDIDTAKAERERYHTVDQPEYRKWLNGNFGEILTAIRDLQQKLAEAEALIEEVQAEFFFSNDNDVSEAYRRVKNRRENPPQEEAGTRSESSGEEEFDAEEDEFRKLFEEMFGKEDEDPFQGNGSQRKSRSRGASESDFAPRERETNARVKDLYRQLVRRLHPDHVADLSPKQIEWWHQAQAAYNEGNVEKLEMLLVLTDIEKDGSREASVGLLAKITSEFKRALRALKSELLRFRRDPAWKFSAITDRRSIHQQTSFMLEAQKAQLGRVLGQYELQIRAWEESAQQTGRRRKRRRPSLEEEEFSF